MEGAIMTQGPQVPFKKPALLTMPKMLPCIP